MSKTQPPVKAKNQPPVKKNAKERVQEKRENRRVIEFEEQLKSSQSRIERSLTEQLPYREIIDGVMVLENGKAEIGIELDPRPMVFLREDEIQSAWIQIKQVLRTCVPEGCRARYIIESTPMSAKIINEYQARKGSEHEVINELIEIRSNAYQQKRWAGQVMQHRYFITCSVPGIKHKPNTAFDDNDLKILLDRAREVRNRLTVRLRTLGYRPEPMDTQAVFELCRRYLNPGLANTKAPRYIGDRERTYYPKELIKSEGDIDIPTCRRQVISSNIENHRGQNLKVGDYLMKAVTIHRLPDESYINSIDNVVRSLGGHHCYVIVDYHHEPFGPAIRKLGMQSRGDDPNGELDQFVAVDQATRVFARERQELMSHLASTGEHIYRTSVTILMFTPADQPTAMVRAKEDAVNAFSMIGNAAVVVGTIHNLPMYLKENLPFGGGESKFTFKVIETTVGDLVPLTAPWRGSNAPMSLFRNQLGSITAIDFFDPECLSWNGIITGGMGAGKTFLAQSMIRDMIAEDVRVIIIDRGFGYSPMLEGIKAPIITMSAGQNIRMNPFQMIEGSYPDPKEITDIRTILSGMVELDDEPETRELQNALIGAGIQRAFDGQSAILIDPTTNEEYRQTELVFMSTFVRAMENLDTLNGNEIDDMTRGIAKRLAARFGRWTGNTPEGQLVDGPTNIDLDARVILFETSGMDSNPDLGRVAILLLTNMVLAYAMKDKESKKALFIDEAWALLNHPTAKNIIMNVARRSRRYGMAMYLMSQTISDFLDMADMLQTVSYIFLGKNCGSRESLAKIPDMTDIGIEYQQTIGMNKGKYSEFLCMIRKQNAVDGDVIRVEAEGMEYFMFTTDREEMNKRLNLCEELGIYQHEAARILAERRNR